MTWNTFKNKNILPIKSKFFLKDLVLFHKLLNSLVSINLPDKFTFCDSRELRYTRKTVDSIRNIFFLQNHEFVECGAM